MEAALASLSAEAEDAIHLGYNILIVSDRKVSAELMPIPALLATAAVHQHLVRKGLRTSTGLVVETGSAREVHHFALLAGYGAEAIHPYLALETLASLPDAAPARGQGERAVFRSRQGACPQSQRQVFQCARPAERDPLAARPTNRSAGRCVAAG